jgi:glycosyltransferase involved in cell wall biosynthesis
MRSAPLVVLGGTVYERYALEAGAQRVLVSYPAVSPSAEPLGLDARRPEMLAATAWKHGKDPERLLPLLERAPGMRLVLAGEWLDQRLRDDLEREARARGLSERLDVTGRLSEAELAGRYARATFVVQAWPSPGFGLSPLEAAAAGTTFVVPRGQGSAEVFREGIDGLFFDLDDDAALHAAVDALSGDPARAVGMGRNAWGWVQERHSWAARSSELAAALAETASGAIDGRFRPGAAEGEDEDVRR